MVAQHRLLYIIITLSFVFILEDVCSFDEVEMPKMKARAQITFLIFDFIVYKFYYKLLVA